MAVAEGGRALVGDLRQRVEGMFAAESPKRVPGLG